MRSTGEEDRKAAREVVLVLIFDGRAKNDVTEERKVVAEGVCGAETIVGVEEGVDASELWRPHVRSLGWNINPWQM